MVTWVLGSGWYRCLGCDRLAVADWPGWVANGAISTSRSSLIATLGRGLTVGQHHIKLTVTSFNLPKNCILQMMILRFNPWEKPVLPFFKL